MMKDFACIIIGASTGGPKALRVVLKNMSKQISKPIYVVQKIPPGLFSESLADGLNEITDLKVKVFENAKKVEENEVSIIPGGFNIEFSDDDLKLKKVDAVYNNTPHLNVTFRELMKFYNKPILVVILTGMFLDDSPLDELNNIRKNEGYVIVQDPKSCFIPNMPQSIIDNKCFDEISTLNNISDNILEIVKKYGK